MYEEGTEEGPTIADGSASQTIVKGSASHLVALAQALVRGGH